MIYAICGTPGSYKSCYAVEKFLLPALKSHRKVYTNIEGLNPAYIATYYDLDPVDVDSCLNILGRVYDDDGSYHEDRDRIRKFYDDLPQNALVIIDEAQNYFSSRDFKEGFSADLIPWLTKHRHLGNDVVWITQVMDSVDITFRRNTHLTYALKRAENIGFKNAAFVYIFDRADTERRHLARKSYRPDPTIFKLYSSYQNDQVVEKRKSYNVFLRSPFFWLMILCAIVVAWTFLSGNFQRNILHKDPGQGKPKKKTEVVAPPPSQEVKQDEVKDEEKGIFDTRCIARTSKVRGIYTYYLDDGTAIASPGGFKFCK